MSTPYQRFLEQRTHFGEDSGFVPSWFPEKIFPFQRSMVEWACKKGRAALFEDVGLGKSVQELTWAQNIRLMNDSLSVIVDRNHINSTKLPSWLS